MEIIKIAGISLGVTVTSIALIRIYLNRKWGNSKSSHSLKGKTYIVTGANSGIGLETAKALSRRQARVVFACRNTSAAKAEIDKFKKEEKNHGEIIIFNLDLASFESIREFAKFVKVGFGKIDCLINNAGVYIPLVDDQKTVEGFEIHLGVNHLGHFLVTKLLLELLEKAAPSRVVIVSSTLHEKSNIEFDDMNLEKIIAGIKKKDKEVIKKAGRNLGYCNSKMMNVHFGRALAERTKDKGIDVYMACPGFTMTNLFRHSIKWYYFIPMFPILLFYMRSASKGAQSIIHCATDKEIEGQTGSFWRNCELYDSKMKPNKEVEDKLWDWSERCVAAGKMVPV